MRELYKWRFTGTSPDGAIIVKGTFRCPYQDAFEAAAEFRRVYSEWSLKTLSLVKVKTKASQVR